MFDPTPTITSFDRLIPIADSDPGSLDRHDTLILAAPKGPSQTEAQSTVRLTVEPGRV
jgi:hypothetical protein